MLTADRLREVLDYSPDSGLFVWIKRTGKKSKPGKIAGSLDNNGYVVIRIDKRIYKAGRLAWLWMMGEWPRATIDHKNGVQDDNRWANLREASYSQNNANRRTRDKRSGLKGVRPNGRRWCAYFRNKYIGTFDTPEEASAAYLSAAQAAFGEFARG